MGKKHPDFFETFLKDFTYRIGKIEGRVDVLFEVIEGILPGSDGETKIIYTESNDPLGFRSRAERMVSARDFRRSIRAMRKDLSLVLDDLKWRMVRERQETEAKRKKG